MLSSSESCIDTKHSPLGLPSPSAVMTIWSSWIEKPSLSKNSITSKFSERHLKGFVKALKDINKYLNKNKNLKKKIYNEFQYRLRGEYVNLHTRIYGSKVKTSLKKKYCSFLKENLTSFINKDYKPITKKDFILKTIM